MNSSLYSFEEYDIPRLLGNYWFPVKVECEIVQIFIENVLPTCIGESVIIVKWRHKFTFICAYVTLSLNHKVELSHWVIKIQLELGLLCALIHIKCVLLYLCYCVVSLLILNFESLTGIEENNFGTKFELHEFEYFTKRWPRSIDTNHEIFVVSQFNFNFNFLLFNGTEGQGQFWVIVKVKG